MSARPIPPGDYSPPLPEIRHLFGSFAELRARIRARRFPGMSAIESDTRTVDPASIRRAERTSDEPGEAEGVAGSDP